MDNNKCTNTNICTNVNRCNNNDDFYLKVSNFGLYVARFSGSYFSTKAFVKFTSKNLYIGQFQIIKFPKDTETLDLVIENLYFIGVWIQFFISSYKFPRKNICINCAGPSFLPFATEVPCPNSLDLMCSQDLQLQNDFLLNQSSGGSYRLKNSQNSNNNCNIVTSNSYNSICNNNCSR